MKIKMKTFEVIELFENISNFLKKDIDFPKQMIWDLDENYETLHHIVDKFESRRNKLLAPLNEKHAFEPAEEEGKVVIKKEFTEEFMKVNEEVNEYLNTENEFEVKTFNKKDLPDTFSFKDWKALKFMCVD